MEESALRAIDGTIRVLGTGIGRHGDQMYRARESSWPICWDLGDHARLVNTGTPANWDDASRLTS